jgi:hypothetical protein
MTIRELIEELNTLVAEGMDENARVRSAEDEDIFSITESVDENEVIIYF